MQPTFFPITPPTTPSVVVDELMDVRARENEIDERPVWEWGWEPAWMAEFLRVLSIRPNVTGAARAAGVSPQAVYKARDRDVRFRGAWQEVLEESYDNFEYTALQLASTGLENRETRTTTERALVNGQLTVVKETVVVVEGRVIAPQLTALLLRAHRPKKFAPPAYVREHGGRDGAPIEREVVFRPPPNREHALEVARLMFEQAKEDAVELVEGDGYHEEDDGYGKMAKTTVVNNNGREEHRVS